MGHSSLKKEDDNVCVYGEGRGYTTPPHMTHTTIQCCKSGYTPLTWATPQCCKSAALHFVPKFLYTYWFSLGMKHLTKHNIGRAVGRRDTSRNSENRPIM